MWYRIALIAAVVFFVLGAYVTGALFRPWPLPSFRDETSDVEIPDREPATKATPLVIATETDAARTKVAKWITRGEQIQASLTELPDPTMDGAKSSDWQRTFLLLIDHLTQSERVTITQWHEGVIQELQALGGGALGLYGASERPSYALFSALHDNRRFLTERLVELRTILERIDAILERSDDDVAAIIRHKQAPPRTGSGAELLYGYAGHTGRRSSDANVLVAYSESTDPRLSIRFRFPDEPDPHGAIVLVPGHGRAVLWEIELISYLDTDIPNVAFNILLPARLVPSLRPVGDLKYSVHEVPERLIRDGERGSLCLNGSIGPLRGGGWTTALAFTIGIHYAREIPVKVKLSSDETGNVEYCAPIVGVLEPIRGS